MLSILIPTYNYSVLNLVKQVHMQAEEAQIIFEIIVVDDCSTDLNILNENNKIAQLTNCLFIKNEQNLGRTASRNLLAKKAAFNTLLFLDADVLPKYNDFISRFNLTKNKDQSVIYGGVCYEEEVPENNKVLRWKYGKCREAKSVEKRLKEPHFIISQNLLIKKNVFREANTLHTNAYGLDILFSNNLKKNNILVKHIDNPVIHLGLENSSSFLKKSIAAVKTTLQLEKDGLMDADLRPLQKSYLDLKKWNLLTLFNSLNKLFKTNIEKNLLSKNPSLFLFDMYRLSFYVIHKIKSND